VIGWWVALLVRPEWRSPFRPFSTPDAVLLAFALGDLLILGIGSAFVALSQAHAARLQRAVAWLVAGATVYAALYTLALALGGAAPPLGALLMCPAAVATTIAAFSLDDEISAIPTSGTR
jgi:sulfite exporter TauE/SafE